MQMVKVIFIIILSIWFSLVAFMPKEELYYKLEQQLVQQGIELNEKSIKSGLFSLSINDVDVYVEGIKVAHIEHMDFLITFIFNTLDLYNIKLDKALNSFIPQETNEIQEASIKYTLISPFKASIILNANFCKAIGYIDINRTLRLNISELKDIQTLKQVLKKDNNGWYYETKF